MSEKGSKIKEELQDRLDDLFSEEDDGSAVEETPGPDAATDAPPTEAEPVTEAADANDDSEFADISDLQPDPADSAGSKSKAPDPSDPPLLDLNATILSLDWEITDATLRRLIKEIDRLKATYQHENLPFMFLQLLGSIGKYISVKKVNAHPDSIKLLHSVYNGFETVINSPELPDLEKKKILSNEVRQFKSLKQRIRVSKTQEAKARKPAAEEAAAVDTAPADAVPAGLISGVTDATGRLVSLDEMLTEIRKAIRDELSAFKTELNAMLGDDR